jgi:hypothetical protein
MGRMTTGPSTEPEVPKPEVPKPEVPKPKVPVPEVRIPKLPTLDARLVSALLAVVLSGALMAVAAFFEWGARSAVSVEIGAAVAASNLYVLSRIAHAMIVAGQGGGGAAAWGILALGKMLLLFGGIWWVMARGLVDPLGLVVGYGSLPIGIAIGSIVSDKTDTRP